VGAAGWERPAASAASARPQLTLRARSAAVAILAGAVVLTVGAGAAAATDVGAGRLRTLAAQAQHDPAALAALRRVDRVDGRRFAVNEALAGAHGRDLTERLLQLAAAPERPTSGEDPARVRRAAGKVLSERRFGGSRLPRPFKGVLDSIGEALRPVWHKITGAIRDLVSITPGGQITVWSVTAAILLLLLVTFGSRALRHRAVGAAADRPERETPAPLERAADEAERAGHLELALRLRFRAGLLRLDARQVIAFRPSISTREVSRAVRSPEFDRLAALFDGVAYGGRPASPDDLESSRHDWDAVIREVAR